MAEGAQNSALMKVLNNDLSLLLEHLKFNDGKKPKFLWLGSKEQLGKFIILVFGNPSESLEDNQELNWTEDTKHNMVSLQLNHLTFKFYTTTATFVIQGQHELRAKEKVYNLLALLKADCGETDLEKTDLSENNGDNSEATINSIGYLIDSSVMEVPQTDVSIREESNVTQEIDSLKKEFNKMKSVVDALVSRGNMQIERDVNNTSSAEEVLSLKQQVAELSLDNNKLTRKVDELEKEKESFLTVIRVLHDVKQAASETSCESNKETVGDPHKMVVEKAVLKDEGNSKRGKKKNKKSVKNKHQPSSEINGNFANEDDVQIIPPDASLTTQASEPKNDGNGTKQQTTTLILGDSIINRLSSYQLSKSTKSKVNVRSFSGAHVRHMYHYMLPSLQDVKPANVVLHVETNDLNDKTPQSVAEEILDLAHHIEKNHPGTNVSLSEMTQRFDSDDLSRKVGEANKVISKYCSQSGRVLIKHKNIDITSLSKRKLHLNSKGVAILASNFTNSIKNMEGLN